MASKITSCPVTGESETQNEHKHPLMPRELLVAAMKGNEAYLNQLLGLNNEEEDHPQPSQEEEEHPPHTMISIDDDTPMEPSDGLIRSTTGMGDTILHMLSAYGHEKLVSKICMKDSSLLKAHNVRNETPFHHAARFGHENTILKLIHCAKSVFGKDVLIELLRQKNCLGETALHEAAKRGHGAVVSTLMEEDQKLAGLVNDDSVSPLYLATARGSVDLVHNMVEKLLGQEITPAYYSGPKQQTALIAAVLQDTELTKELLKLYSEPLGKETDETGRTPLHFVALIGDYDIAKLLLDKDPSLAYIPDSGRSFPIHTAVRMGHVKMIRLLLQWCPDPCQLLDENGKNILHIAVEAETTDILYRSLIYPNDRLTTSYSKKMFTRMANTMDNKGNTPLHLAAEYEYNDVMVSLFKKGKADLTLQNKEGLTAVDIAMIKLRKYTKPYQVIDVLGAFFIRIRKPCFSRGELIRGSNEDDILTTDTRGAKNSSKSVMMKKAQFLGLGSVLVATVTFAAAFTLPGGTNQNTGTPILGRKYIFKAFVIADGYAFLQSFLATMYIIYSSYSGNSNEMQRSVDYSFYSLGNAARFMLIAVGLALYLLLAPIGNLGALVLAVSLFVVIIASFQFDAPLATKWDRLERQLPRHIYDRESGVKPKFIRSARERIYLNIEMWAPIIIKFGMFLIIFLFALI
ncbi:Ankyrin-3 [Carex littledalei]|uniref:Ankyrin-3 n=1 Tax=Carex littledalei TaxID=544730 RepID=A0A833RIW7_9POAL|nr:Ankyrin-3 [Carex littledalei]